MTNPVGGVPNSDDQNSKWLPNFQEAETKGTFNADNLVFKQVIGKKEACSDEDAKKVYEKHLENDYPEYKEQKSKQAFYEWLKGDNIPKDANFGQKALAWSGRIGRGALAAVSSPLMLFTACKEFNEPDQPKSADANVTVELDPTTTTIETTTTTTTETKTIDAHLDADDEAKIKSDVKNEINKEIDELNNSNPKTTTGVGYQYSLNEDGKSGNITINGTNITLPFDIEVKPGKAVVNDDHSLDLTTDISAKGREDIIKTGDVVEYINAVGWKTSTDGVSYIFSKDGEEAKVTFDNGFTHIVGDKVAIDANSAVGQLQSALKRIALDVDNKLLTNAQSSQTADTDVFGGEFAFALKSRGDLNKIISGNPEVQFTLGDINIEGKVSTENGVVTITSNDGNKVTLTPTVFENLSDTGNPLNGLNIIDEAGNNYDMAYDPLLDDGTNCWVRKQRPNGKTGTATSFKLGGESFNIIKAVKDSDEFFEESKTSLKEEYDKAVGKFKTETTYHKDGTEITETTTTTKTDTITTVNEYEVKADAEVSITWAWPWDW